MRGSPHADGVSALLAQAQRRLAVEQRRTEQLGAARRPQTRRPQTNLPHCRWVEVKSTLPADLELAIPIGAVCRVVSTDEAAASLVISHGGRQAVVPARCIQPASTRAIGEAMQAEIEMDAARRVGALHNVASAAIVRCRLLHSSHS